MDAVNDNPRPRRHRLDQLAYVGDDVVDLP